MNPEESRYQRPVKSVYNILRFCSRLLCRLIFRVRVTRNEVADAKGAYLLLCNHECALDFIYPITATRRLQTFVVSKAFHDTIPFGGAVEKMRLISKQQFQTRPSDLTAMKSVIRAGQPLVLYPAGLMPENGCSTPIPGGTYKFLKRIDADIYVGRVRGSYFVMPKWSKKLRPGRTFFETYKLFDREQLQTLSVEEIREKVNAALLFDAYEEQETDRVRYAGNDRIEGLEKVLYRCPACGCETAMTVRNKNTLFCEACGYQAQADALGFLHTPDGSDELRRASSWDREILEAMEREVLARNGEYSLSSAVEIHMIDAEKRRFVPVGSGVLTLDRQHFSLTGTVGGQPLDVTVGILNIPCLPSSPVRNCIELQDQEQIYRCVVTEPGFSEVRYLHLLKIFYRLNHEKKPETD